MKLRSKLVAIVVLPLILAGAFFLGSVFLLRTYSIDSILSGKRIAYAAVWQTIIDLQARELALKLPLLRRQTLIDHLAQGETEVEILTPLAVNIWNQVASDFNILYFLTPADGRQPKVVRLFDDARSDSRRIWTYGREFSSPLIDAALVSRSSRHGLERLPDGSLQLLLVTPHFHTGTRRYVFSITGKRIGSVMKLLEQSISMPVQLGTEDEAPTIHYHKNDQHMSAHLPLPLLTPDRRRIGTLVVDEDLREITTTFYRAHWVSVLAPLLLITIALTMALLFSRNVSSRVTQLLQDIGFSGKILPSAWQARDELDMLGNVLKRSQMELIQARKMEAVGTLAAGIAHEINTPTQFVGDNVTFMKEAFADLAAILDKYRALENALDRLEQDGVREALAEAHNLESALGLDFILNEWPKAIQQTQSGVKRIGAIVQAMREFADNDRSDEHLPHDLNKAIDTTLTLTKNELAFVADVTTDLQPNLPLVACNRNEINQVLLIVLVNAAQAIQDRHHGERLGTIAVSSRREGKERVRLSIADDGTGIPESIRERVFEHFFTTREVGQGSGQGLSIAYDIVVTRHHGELYFDSQTGKGTVFHIVLPVHGQEPGPEAAV